MPAAPLLQQVQQVAQGQPVEPSAWDAAVTGCIDGIRSLLAVSALDGSASSGKKRKHQGSAGSTRVDCGALADVRELALLLAQLPLG